jgi:hypothetical protein
VIRTRQLALALLAPFLVTGCMAVTPNTARPPRDVATAAVSRPAAEQAAPRQGRGDLVESGERKRRGKKAREKASGRNRAERAEEGTRLRTQGRGESSAGRAGAALRSRAEARPAGPEAPAARRHTGGVRHRAKGVHPRARAHPAPPKPRRHGARRSGGHTGFRMGAWCRQARGVASSEVVSLCHRAYGH